MGFFSWKTIDTNQSISNKHSYYGALPVVMVNTQTGEIFEELDYDGYGVFGGKDYYELVAELNGYGSNRSLGIEIELDETFDHIAPLLLSYENKDNWRDYIDMKPMICDSQGFFYDFDEEDD